MKPKPWAVAVWVFLLLAIVAAPFVSLGLTSNDDGASDASLLFSTTTVEYLASTAACPAGLPELEVTRRSGTALALDAFLELPGATVLAFNRPAAAETPSETLVETLGGFVGTRDGVVWSFVVPEDGSADDPASGPAGGTADTRAVNTRAALLEPPLLDLSANTATEHDQGLVGMAIGPNSEWLYLNRTASNGASVLTAHAIRTRPASGITNQVVLLGETIELLRIQQPSPQHNGGDIVFGPQGYMYVSFGDGGGLGDPLGNAQDLSTPLGAVLRLAVDPAAPAGQRVQPAPGNPYLSSMDSSRDNRIWVSGVRNPYRMSYDPVDQQLWVADVGQQCVEEITVLSLDEGGADLGWNVFEGNHRFVGEMSRPHRQPDFSYRHGRGLCSTVGGRVYRGSALADLQGQFVWADLCGGRLFALDPAAAGQTAAGSNGTATGQNLPVVDLGVAAERILGLVSGPADELYVIDLEFGIYRLATTGI